MPNGRTEEIGEDSTWGARPRNARDAIAQAVRQIDKTAVTFADARRANKRREVGAVAFCLDRLTAQIDQIRAALADADAHLSADSKAGF